MTSTTPEYFRDRTLKTIEEKFHKKSDREYLSYGFSRMYEFGFPFIGFESKFLDSQDTLGMSYVSARLNWWHGNECWSPFDEHVFERMWYVVDKTVEEVYGHKGNPFSKETFDLYHIVCYVKYANMVRKTGEDYKLSNKNLREMFLPFRTWSLTSRMMSNYTASMPPWLRRGMTLSLSKSKCLAVMSEYDRIFTVEDCIKELPNMKRTIDDSSDVSAFGGITEGSW